MTAVINQRIPNYYEDQSVEFQKNSSNTVTKKVSHCFAKVRDGLKEGLSFTADSVSKLSGIKSILKFSKASIDFAKFAFSSQSTGVANLNSQIKVADGLLGCLELGIDIKEWFVPIKVKEKNKDGKEVEVKDANGKCVKKVFWRHKGVSRLQIASKLFGTLSKVVALAKFLLDIGLVKLGNVAASLSRIPFFRVVLSFSPLTVVKDLFSIVSGGLQLADDAVKLQSNAIQSKVAKWKLAKWTVKDELRDYVTLSQEAKEEKLLAKYSEDKYPNYDFAAREDLFLNENKNSYTSAKEKLAKLAKTEITEENIQNDWTVNKANFENENIVNVENFENPQNTETKIDKCLRKKQVKALDLKKTKIVKTGTLLSVAFNVAKIAAATLGLIGIFASLSVIPAFIGVVATLWLVTSTIGMVSLYYKFRQANKSNN